MGCDMTYAFIDTTNTGLLQYEVVISFYRSCSGISAPTAANVDADFSISNTCNLAVPTFNFTQKTDDLCDGGGLSGLLGCKVLNLCPAFFAQSACASPPGTYPGVERYVYTAIVSLSKNCVYTLHFSENARNSPLSNITGGGTASLYMEATINTHLLPDGHYGNNSPKYLNEPSVFTISNKPFEYSLGAYDKEGDSLVYELITPMDDGGVPLTYQPGFSLQQPMTSATPFYFSASEGVMNCLPNPATNESDVIAVRISEYRNGELIGTTMRDEQINVLPGDDDLVAFGEIIHTNNCTSPNNHTINACTGSSISFDITCTSQQGFAPEIVTALEKDSAYYPGMIVSHSGTAPTDTVHVVWNNIPAIRLMDLPLRGTTPNCPVKGRAYRNIRFYFSNQASILASAHAVCGNPVRLSGTGNNIHWQPAALVSDPSASSTFVNPSSDTWFYLSSSCGTDSVLIQHQTPIVLTPLEQTASCNGDYIHWQPTISPSGHYHFHWWPSGKFFNSIGGIASDTLATPFYRKQYQQPLVIQITNDSNCSIFDTLHLEQQPVLQVGITASSTVIPGLQAGQLIDTLRALAFSLRAGQCGFTTDTLLTHPISSYNIGFSTTPEAGTSPMYPSPLGANRKSARHQYLFRASELKTALGAAPKLIHSFSLQIATLNSATTLNGLTIKMSCTSSDSLVFFENNLYQVADPTNYTPNAGWNTFNFNRPFFWDGISNVVVDICFSNSSAGSPNNKMMTNLLPFRATHFTVSNAGSVCGYTGSGNSGIITLNNWAYYRPNVKFGVTTPSNPVISNNLQFQWQPLSGQNNLYYVNDSIALTRPVSNQWYTVSLIDSGICNIAADSVYIRIGTYTPFNASLSVSFHYGQPDSAFLVVTPAGKNYDWYYRALSSGNFTHLTWTSDHQVALKPDSGQYFVVATDTSTGFFDTTNIVSVHFPNCDYSQLQLQVQPLGNNEYNLCISPSFPVYWWRSDEVTGAWTSLMSNTSCMYLSNQFYAGTYYAVIPATSVCRPDTVGGFHYLPPAIIQYDSTNDGYHFTVTPANLTFQFEWYTITLQGDTVLIGTTPILNLSDTFGGGVFVVITNPNTGAHDTSAVTHLAPRYTSGINELSSTPYYIIPNPAKHEVSITVISQQTRIEIFNTQGALLSKHDHATKIWLPVDEWPRGIYLIQATTPNGVYRKRLVLE